MPIFNNAMRKYTKLIILCADDQTAEIATAFLADYPFDSFDSATTDEGVELHAFILAEAWQQCREEALDVIDDYAKTMRECDIEDVNWNEQWERDSFQRVDIDGRMLIRSPHHAPAAEGVIDIVVAPRMSFGSGHHHTSQMMCRAIMRLTPADAAVLDVGCGTGILSIAALKCGAQRVDAVDIDPWSVESAREAARLNGVEERMEILLGTVGAVAGRSYDMVLANINRNILIADMGHYAAALSRGGVLLLSGFLDEDIEAIASVASSYGITVEGSQHNDGWVCLECRKTQTLL